MTKKVSLLIAIMVVLSGGFLYSATAQITLPTDFSGTIDNAPYRIAVPANWNGVLLVYAHGYRDLADHPGETDNRTADIAPSPALEPILLSQGYALSGSAYKNNGWAVQEGVADLKNLVGFFRRRVSRPSKVILWGVSMGTVIGFKSMEQPGNVYDGALCACAVGGGAPSSWDAAGDLMLAYDTVFGMPAAWGTPGDVRDDLDFDTEVLAKLGPELQNQANYPKFEFLRLVTGTPGRGIAPPAPPSFYPNWVVTDMFFSTEARAELERRAGGPVVQNLNRVYYLTDEEKTYLATLGISASIADAYLAALNARRNISAPPASRLYVEQNARYSGKILKPVLTLHTLYDPLVPVSHERDYSFTVARAARENLLFQTYTNGNGHCNFTGEQLIASLTAITNWVNTGVKPTAANFPTQLGFLDSTFVPPPLNQP
ncbi:MAG: hypothetical protein LH614_19495 [Pyrinomonadaceae bacterium]|nr:hypothetical protein [Pyrinomonadaceae bacterium]